MRDHSVAIEIANQIGNRTFFMLGTRSKDLDGNAIVFDIRGSRTWNAIRIELNGRDTYDVTFFKRGRAPSFKVVSKVVEDVYVDGLHSLIEHETGLHTSLGTMTHRP
jgi:hypothetical protein